MTILEASLEPGGRALVIEPDDETRRTLLLLLRGWRFDVRSFSAASSAFADSYAATAQVLIVGQLLQDGTGHAVLHGLRQRGWDGRAILVVEQRTEDCGAEALQAGFKAVLDKPIGRLDLLNALVK